MNFRTTAILALILAIGIAAVALFDKKDEKKQEAKTIEEQLLAVEAADVTELILLPSGIRCVKDSLDWKIEQPVQTDADRSAIETVLNSFKTAKKDRVVSSDPSEYPVYGLQPPVGVMVIAQKNRVDTLWVGDETPTGGNVFARISGSPDVFLSSTTLRANAQKTLFDLRNKSVLGFETFQVREIQLAHKGGRFSLVKKGGEWAMTAPRAYEADKTEVDKVINRLQTERMREVVEENPADLKAYGLDAPSLRVDLSLGENLARKTLLIGKPTGDQYFARDDSRSPVFLVDSSFVSVLKPTLFDLRNKKLTQFSTDAVTRFELEFSSQKIVCSKDSTDTWVVEEPISRKAKSWKMSTITREAAELEVAKFVDDIPKSLAPFGLAAPQVHAKFYDDQKLLLDVMLGKVDGDYVYAKLVDQDHIYLLEKDILETWTPTADDISEEPETSDDASE